MMMVGIKMIDGSRNEGLEWGRANQRIRRNNRCNAAREDLYGTRGFPADPTPERGVLSSSWQTILPVLYIALHSGNYYRSVMTTAAASLTRCRYFP